MPVTRGALTDKLSRESERVLSLKVGEKRGIHYASDEKEPYPGPEAMHVLEDGRLAIADTHANRLIIASRGAVERMIPLEGAPQDFWWKGGKLVVIELAALGSHLRLRALDGSLLSDVLLEDFCVGTSCNEFHAHDCDVPLLKYDRGVLPVVLEPEFGVAPSSVPASEACPGVPVEEVRVDFERGRLEHLSMDGISLPMEVFQAMSYQWSVQYSDASRVVFSSYVEGGAKRADALKFVAVARDGRILASASLPMGPRFVGKFLIAVAPDGNVFVGLGDKETFDVLKVGWEVSRGRLGPV